jgi:iron complex transport system substrate-binding protein
VKQVASKLAAAGGAAIVVALFVFAFRFQGDLPQPARIVQSEVMVEAEDPFPRTVTDYFGDHLTFEGPPQRIGSQALTIDHFLLATTSVERIVALSNYARDERYSFVVDLAESTNAVVATDAEAIVRRNPDLLLTAHSARADQVDLARSAGIPVFRLQTVFENFDGMAKSLATVGRIMGDGEKARMVIAELYRRAEAAKARRPVDSKPVRVLALTVYSSSYGKGSLFDYIVTELGAVNVGTEQGLGPYGQIGEEQVASWDPDWIIAGAETGTIEEVRARILAGPGVSVTKAGRTGQVLVVRNRQFLTMSHHAVELMEALSEAIYGEGE